MVDPSSGRATLLESIRQAGGIGKAKLRSVKERKLEKKKQKEQEQGEGTKDLLQQLGSLSASRKSLVATLIPSGLAHGSPGGSFPVLSSPS